MASLPGVASHAVAARNVTIRLMLKAAHAKTKSASTLSARGASPCAGRRWFQPPEDAFDPGPGSDWWRSRRGASCGRRSRCRRVASRSAHVRRDPELAHGRRSRRCRRLVGAQRAGAAAARRLGAEHRSAASRSAGPSAVVACASTISPWRFSISTCPRYARRASPCDDLRYSRASGSVVDACVSLVRVWP